MGERILEPREVPAVLLRAFPAYSGRRFAVVVCESVELQGAYWSDGSRNTWRAVELATGRTSEAGAVGGRPITAPAMFGGAREIPRVNIPEGWAVVEHSIFCGRDQGLTFYIRPDNAAALLPAPAGAVEASRAARVVLACTVGIVSRARRDEAASQYAVKGAAYDSGLAECKALGWINSQGAATVAGKNAAPEIRRELEAERMAAFRAARQAAEG